MSEEFDFDAESAAFKKQYEAGDGAAFLHMIAVAWAHHQPVPEWAGAALVRELMRGADGMIGSWDHRFGPPWRIGKRKEALRLSQARRAWTAGQKLIEEETKKREKLVAEETKKRGKPLSLAEETKIRGKPLPRDNEFFEAVAKLTHVGGRSKVTTLYAEFAEIIERINAELKLPD